MQVLFTRWCLNAEDRTPVAVNPKRVDCLEHFSPAFRASTGEDFPAATKIVMQGKQEYVVQGDVREVQDALNATEMQ